ncbi:MAG: hypothetical protein R3A46_18105 [Thermomicrobiales bacterium]
MPAPLRIVLGAALTLVVMVLSVLPPILHFLTGPVGPGIGGFIAGRQFHLSDREAAIMGVILALAAGIPAFILMDRLISNEPFAITAAIVASLWSGGLATVAAWFAGGDEQPEDEGAAAD